MIEILLVIILLLFIIAYVTTNTNKSNNRTDIYSAEYYRGLNYLLNNEDDKALKIFADLILINSKKGLAYWKFYDLNKHYLKILFNR